MTSAEYFAMIMDKFENEFPQYHYSIEQDVDSNNSRMFIVYDVAAADIRNVKRFLNDLDWEYVNKNDYSLSPIVIDKRSTTKHYADRLPTTDEMSDPAYRFGSRHQREEAYIREKCTASRQTRDEEELSQLELAA